MEDYFTNTVSRDLLELVRGRRLGSGVSREVYACRLAPDLVVKFETRAQSFHNVLEWSLWQELIGEGSKQALWFAPCVNISPCGSILLQKFCEPFKDTKDKRLPAKVPSFFTDLKVENWGLYNGRPVCLDYGITLMTVKGMGSSLKRANWWSHRVD